MRGSNVRSHPSPTPAASCPLLPVQTTSEILHFVQNDRAFYLHGRGGQNDAGAGMRPGPLVKRPRETRPYISRSLCHSAPRCHSAPLCHSAPRCHSDPHCHSERSEESPSDQRDPEDAPCPTRPVGGHLMPPKHLMPPSQKYQTIFNNRFTSSLSTSTGTRMPSRSKLIQF